MELNAFTYDDEGFICEKDPGKVYHKWADIETVFGYKRDLITTDEIYLDIFTSENSLFSISESIPGWYLFNQKLIESIASIP